MRILFTALACLISVSVFGQVVYTDLIPDIIVDVDENVDEIDTYELDFNSDEVVDISIYMSYSDDFEGFGLPVTIGAIHPVSTNEVVGSDTTLMGVVDLLIIEGLHQYFDIINVSLNYVSNSTSFAIQDPILRVAGMVPGISLGDFQENIDGYFGVKFDIMGNSHYGWVRVIFTDEGTSLKIKDFAYEASPNIEIIVGDDGSGIIPGCIIETACNYNANATDSDNTCVFVGDSCDDEDPNTIDDQIQNDCECAGTPNSIVDELVALSVLIYPNPASNNLTVDLGDLNGVNTTIKLYDASSKLVFEKQSTSTLTIDVSGFAKGMYSLELSTEEQVLRSQVIVD